MDGVKCHIIAVAGGEGRRVMGVHQSLTFSLLHGLGSPTSGLKSQL